MIPLQTSFNELIAPDFLTTELAIVFAIVLFSALYASIKLRSMFGIFGWMLMIVALMVSFFTNLQLIWFWLTVIAEAFILTFASIAYARAAARQ